MLSSVSKVLFWKYSRGSWQYDIFCGIILLFIFLTPVGVFDGSAFVDTKEAADQDGERARSIESAVPNLSVAVSKAAPSEVRDDDSLGSK